jgi:hypothetical protein
MASSATPRVSPGPAARKETSIDRLARAAAVHVMHRRQPKGRHRRSSRRRVAVRDRGCATGADAPLHWQLSRTISGDCRSQHSQLGRTVLRYLGIGVQTFGVIAIRPRLKAARVGIIGR